MHPSGRIAARFAIAVTVERVRSDLVLAAPAADLRDDVSLVRASYLGEKHPVRATEGSDR